MNYFLIYEGRMDVGKRAVAKVQSADNMLVEKSGDSVSEYHKVVGND